MIVARLVADDRPDVVFDDDGKFSCPESPIEAELAGAKYSLLAGAPPSVPRTLRSCLQQIADETGRTLVDVAIPLPPSAFEQRVY